MSKRAQSDLMKLISAGFDVELSENPAAAAKGCLEFLLKGFQGPKETPYEGGRYALFVHLPPDYPLKSPSIGFRTRIFHPNIDERSGSVCLDVINQSWSPLFDLSHIFTVFLPQLLAYANPADPLNPEAAAMMNREPDKFSKFVKEHTAKYASAPSPSPAPSSGSSSSSSFSSSSSSTAPTASAKNLPPPPPSSSNESKKKGCSCSSGGGCASGCGCGCGADDEDDDGEEDGVGKSKAGAASAGAGSSAIVDDDDDEGNGSDFSDL